MTQEGPARALPAPLRGTAAQGHLGIDTYAILPETQGNRVVVIGRAVSVDGPQMMSMSGQQGNKNARQGTSQQEEPGEAKMSVTNKGGQKTHIAKGKEICTRQPVRRMERKVT